MVSFEADKASLFLSSLRSVLLVISPVDLLCVHVKAFYMCVFFFISEHLIFRLCRAWRKIFGADRLKIAEAEAEVATRLRFSVCMLDCLLKILLLWIASFIRLPGTRWYSEEEKFN